jgi:hypothetical protein
MLSTSELPEWPQRISSSHAPETDPLAQHHLLTHFQQISPSGKALMLSRKVGKTLTVNPHCVKKSKKTVNRRLSNRRRKKKKRRNKKKKKRRKRKKSKRRSKKKKSG